MFLSTGHQLLTALATIIFVTYLFKHGLSGGLLTFLWHYGPMVVIATLLLRYYYTPIPGLTYSVHQFFPEMANVYANMIGLKRLDVFYGRLVDLQRGIAAHPFSVTDWSMWFTATSVEVLVWILQAVLCALNVPGYLFVGCLSLVGPLFIPWLIVPRLSHFFWNWLESFLQYCWYRVMAAALIFVASTAVTQFIDSAIHGDYSLETLSALTGQIIFVVIAVCWGAFKLDRVVAGLFKGTSDAGGGFGYALMRGRSL
jgi:TrbL/VirB6 plasmid conjugal transfer protein